MEDFEQYKRDFLEANKPGREQVLMRRVRDNMLSWVPEKYKNQYPGHVEEPVSDEEKPKKVVTPKGDKKAGVPKSGTVPVVPVAPIIPEKPEPAGGSTMGDDVNV